MNRRIPFLACALCALVLASAVAAQVTKVDELVYPELPAFDIPQPQRFELDNGLVVMLLEDHELPLINVRVLVHTGSRLEPAGKVGLAQIAGELLRTGGTESMSPDELDLFLETKAASIESSIGVASGSATMSCLTDDFDDVFPVFAEVLRRPRFDQERMVVEKTQIETGISRQNDDPSEIMNREFEEIVLGEDSPYARPATYATVGAVDRDDIVSWHRKYYHPNQMILGMVGDFETAAVLAQVREQFGDWETGADVEPVELGGRTEPSPGVYYVEKNDMTQSSIAMGHFGIRRDNPDYYAVEVLNHVLSGSFASRLFSSVRTKKGLAYSVSGSVGSSWDRPGLFRMWMTTKVETTGAGIEALIEEAQNLTAEPPTTEEVAKAKESMLNSFIFNSDSMQEILSQQLTFEYYGYPLDWLSRYRTGIEAVTAAEVAAAAEKYIDVDDFSILVVGPAEGRDRELSDFGEVTPVDITIPDPPVAEVEMTEDSAAAGTALMARLLEAMGGADAIDAAETARIESRVVANAGGNEMEIGVVMTIAYPDRLSQEMTLPFGTVRAVYSPDEAFVITPQGTQPMAESQQADAALALAIDPIGLLRSRDQLSPVAAGREEVAGTEVELVRLEIGGEPVTLGIDAESGRLVVMRYRGSGMTGGRGDLERIYSDYREVDGVWYPFSSSRTFNGEPASSTEVVSVEINVPAEAALFAAPAEGS